MSLNDRLALAAMRGVMHELEGDPAGAGEVLARLFGGPVVERDLKPENVMAPPVAAPKPARKRKRSRSVGGKIATKRPDGGGTSEAAGLVKQLVARHGTVLAAAEAANVQPAVLRRWRSGRAAPTLESLLKLRAAVEADDQGEDDERSEPTEAARLVSELLDRYETIAAAAKATGLGESHLRSWSQDGPITPRTLGRLREAARAPRGRRDREEATPAAASDEAAAGAGDEEEAA